MTCSLAINTHTFTYNIRRCTLQLAIVAITAWLRQPRGRQLCSLLGGSSITAPCEKAGDIDPHTGITLRVPNLNDRA